MKLCRFVMHWKALLASLSVWARFELKICKTRCLQFSTTFAVLNAPSILAFLSPQRVRGDRTGVAGHSLLLLHQLQLQECSCSQDVYRPHFKPMPVRKLLQESKLPKVGLCWSTWKVMVLPQWKESPVGATSSDHHNRTPAALHPSRKPPSSSPPPSLIVTI